MLEFDPQIVLMDCTAQCREEVIGALVCAMEKAGYVTAAYTGNVLARENRYPTGLPTQGVRVAIPHGMNADGILRQGIGIARLTAPVKFCNMADANEELDVELVFLLANREADAQVEDLRALMECFSQDDLLLGLKEAKDARELICLLQGACERNACCCTE